MSAAPSAPLPRVVAWTAAVAWVAVVACACGPAAPNADAAGDAGSAETAHDAAAALATFVLPAFADLPESPTPPAALRTFFGGDAIATAADWRQRRRPELLALFDQAMYGVPPPPSPVTLLETRRAPLQAGGTLVELELTLTAAAAAAPKLRVALFLPAQVAHPPVLLGLNKCGNASVSADPALTAHEGWREASCPDGRGGRAAYWSIDLALAAGFAVATLHQSDIDPDDRDDIDRSDGLHPHLPAGAPPWATLSAWAYGLSCAVDGLRLLDARDGSVDGARIVVFGHSRRGKAALLAAARDERIAMVWAHQSGRGGAALSRSSGGEPIAAMTTLYPHWFVPGFAAFHDHAAKLPVDQHLLLALVAPRAVRITDGDADGWADPPAAKAAVELAAEVFALHGATPPSWSVRAGGHDVQAGDWQGVLAEAASRWAE